MAAVLKVSSPGDIHDKLLRHRAERAHGGRSAEFIAYEHGTEVGLLSYEDWSDQATAFIFEIFVLPQHRRQGVGALLLSHAEQHALQQDCKIVRLKPFALDMQPSQSQIEAWYTEFGYRRDPNEEELMEKHLPAPGAASQETPRK